MPHYAVSISTFTDKLKEQLVGRVDNFEMYIREKAESQDTCVPLKSKQNWMEDYREWLKSNENLRNEIMKYLLMNTEEDNENK